MNVSIIIPNYNGAELLKKNLTSVFDAARAYKQGEVEIIVVDDSSTDGSVDFIKLQKNAIKLIENKKNLGFSSTVNCGVAEATGEIIILLNTDVAPEKNFLAPLVKHFSDPSVFAVGCMDKSIEDGKVVLRGRGIGKWQRGFLVHARGEVDKTDTLWVSGGSGAFRKSIWDKLGGFNKLYNPFYWEDIDLSYRAVRAGYKIMFEPKSIVVHKHEEGIIKRKYSQFQIKIIAYRNQFIFVWQNAKDFSLLLQHFFWLPYHFSKALTSFDFAFFLGFFQAFLLLPKVIQSAK